MWSYTASGRGFQLPGPTLCVDVRATRSRSSCTTRCREPTSIVFPGQSDITPAATGAQPQSAHAGARRHRSTSLVPGETAPAARRRHHLHLHRRLARAPTSTSPAPTSRSSARWGSTAPCRRPAGRLRRTRRTTAADVDVQRLQQGVPAARLAGRPRLARRRSSATGPSTSPRARPGTSSSTAGRMPDTLAPNNAAWLPSQPYTGLVHITADPQGTPRHKPALIRYANAGPTNYPFHPHGSSQTVITRDGAAMHDADGNDASYGKFLLDVGPGQTIDALETGRWSTHPTAPMRKIPSDIQLPQLQDQIVGPGHGDVVQREPVPRRHRGRRPHGHHPEQRNAASTTTSPTATRSTRRRTTARASAE